MSDKNILLLEPNYKNKYPPIGLMKIATYHRMLGDNVVFYKGNLRDLEINLLTVKCVNELEVYDENLAFDKSEIENYIKSRKKVILDSILESCECNSDEVYNIESIIVKFKKHYWNKEYDFYPKYDRIYISTLFTFYWKITFETINFAKRFSRSISDIKVGGVMATVLFDDIIDKTGVIPIKGLLDKPKILDDDNDIIIDTLPLDYSILDEIEYSYTSNNAYYGYLTRGCIRKCAFCAVPILEPKYQDFISMKNRKLYIDENFGEQRNLLLLDNNVLASHKFEQIIQEIKDMGFYKGAKFIQPNRFGLLINNLKKGRHEQIYIHKIIQYLNLVFENNNRIGRGIKNIFDAYNITNIDLLTKECIIEMSEDMIEAINHLSVNKPVLRYVDFNQGVDARLINETNIRMLSEIAIHPLRIAFDSIKDKDVYIRAIELSAKYGINHLSNYILYNEKDCPEDLYERLKINIELSENLNINIYSFPMKYHPIVGVDRFSRDYMGVHWNRKYIRAIQTILNATKGKIGRGQSFFQEAFGRNLEEFKELLIMPETFILYRKFFRDIGLTQKWREAMQLLSDNEVKKIISIVESNKFTIHTENDRINNVLIYYQITRDNVVVNDKKYSLDISKYRM